MAAIGVEAMLVLLGVKALARKQLLRFALILAAFVVVGFLAVAITTRLIEDWRVVVSGVVGLAAAVLLFLNVRELLLGRLRRHADLESPRPDPDVEPAARCDEVTVDLP